MCSILIFTGTSFHVMKQKDNQVSYSIFKTMSTKKKNVHNTQKTSNMVEPYFTEQWALNNDGTFIPASNYNQRPDFDFSDIGDSDLWNCFYNFPSEGNIRFQFNIPNRENYRRGYNDYSTYSNRGRTNHYYPVNQKTAVSGIDISASKAWNTVGNSGRDVVIAVIDTGFDFTHEELSNAVWTNTGEIPGDGIDNDNNGYIDDVYGWDFYDDKPNSASDINSEYDHGTHVAGIIAAAKNQKGIAGIIANNKVKIMDLKALGGSDGGGETDSVIRAIHYAESMGATICNLSFGTSDYDNDLYNAMKASKMLFVCAAGNGNNINQGYDMDSAPTYPAAFDLDNIISVANLSYNGTLDITSNYGKTSVDIAAPGSYILSSVAGNNYAFMSGTSMAAPMVTAVAAMVYSYRQDITLSEAKDIVLSSAKQLTTLQDKVATAGMVNAYNAVTYK